MFIRALSAAPSPLSKIEYQTSSCLSALYFFKGFVHLLKFSCLTRDLCSPCGMQLENLGKIRAIADDRSLDRYTVQNRFKNRQLDLYRDPTVAKNTSRSDFRIRDLTHYADPAKDVP
jgi:Type IV secretory system Conjugative DNA transfer